MLEKLDNEQLRNLWASSPDTITVVKSRKMERPEHMANIGQKKNEHKILLGKTSRKETTWKIKRRCGGNIKMDIKEIG
jgi:hypothetical protein